MPISAGELLDKITILRIKAKRLTDETKRANVTHELRLLEDIADEQLRTKADYALLLSELLEVNARLWDIEEGKRDCERRKTFDDEFIQLARAVYIENDRRAALKRALNELLGSSIIEEKSYSKY